MIVNDNQVPADTDVLITHTPPVGFGDLCSTGVGRRSFSSLSIRYIINLIIIDWRHNHSHLTRFGQGALSYYTAFKSGSNPSTTSMATYMKVSFLGERNLTPSLCSAPMLGVQNLGHRFFPSLGQDLVISPVHSILGNTHERTTVQDD